MDRRKWLIGLAALALAQVAAIALVAYGARAPRVA